MTNETQAVVLDEAEAAWFAAQEAAGCVAGDDEVAWADEDDDDEDFGGMDEQEMAELLRGLLDGETLEDLGTEPEDVSVRTFSDAGLLTRNEGLVVRVGGAEFQVTIVRS